MWKSLQSPEGITTILQVKYHLLSTYMLLSVLSRSFCHSKAAQEY